MPELSCQYNGLGRPMSELKGLVDNWILLAQGLIGSIGALALAIG
jgi:hypothetical protein